MFMKMIVKFVINYDGDLKKNKIICIFCLKK